MQNKNFILKISVLAASITSALSTAAIAQDASQNETAKDDAKLEVINVTAQRRVQSLQEVPISVSAFYGSELDNLQVNDIGELQSSVPNLTLHQGDAQNAVVYIRGVGQIDSLAFADPGVGIYLDDVYLGRAQGAFLDVFDVERIEVLRGPQGTLYGRNTIGGAIKYVTKKPEDDLAYSLEAGIGNFDFRKFRASVSGALSDKLTAGVAFSYSGRDGFTTNTFDGEDDGDKDLYAFRGAFYYQSSDNVNWVFTVDSSRNNPDHSVTPVARTALFTGQPIENVDPDSVSANFNNLNELVTNGVSLTATWDVSDSLTLKSISALRSMDYDTNLDLDATVDDVFGVFVFQQQEQISQEFQANYLTRNIAGVAGLYYFKEEDVTESGLFGPVISLVTNSENDQENKSYAAYGNLDYFMNEKLTITAGLRYTKEEKTFSRVQQLFASDPTYPPTLGEGDVTLTDFTVSDEWSSLSPKLAISYQSNQDLLFFGSISKGFKSGGFNGRSNTPGDAEPYDQENMWAFEAGVKTDLLDDRLRVNSAIFRNDYEDLQLSSFVADDQGTFSALFTNAGKAIIDGIELEVDFAATENLLISGNLGLMDARYDEYIGAGGVNIADSRELVNTPDVTAQLSFSYEYQTGSAGYFTFSGSASYRSKTYTTVSSSELLAEDARTLLNANINYFTADEQWAIRLAVKNITNKRYISHGFDLSDSGLSQLAYYAEPRTVTLSATYRY